MTKQNIIQQPHTFVLNSDRTKKRSLLKKGIWLYFWLLILEGALRKWFLPGLSTPLLIVRDPVAIVLIIAAINNNNFRINSYITISAIVTTICFFTAIFFGHGNFSVAVYGARITLVHFPLLFLIGQVFSFEDVLSMGKTMLVIAPFMTFLIAVQFYSPQSAWVNQGVGGDIQGAGFSGALGYFRPPGTFSFIVGLTAFYGLLASFVCYFWFAQSNAVKKWVLILATGSLLTAIPLSISRTLLVQVTISVIFSLFMTVRKPKYFARIIFIILTVVILFFVLISFDFFETATHAFTSRFDAANKVEGGLEGSITDRFLGGMLTAITENNSHLKFMGEGLGMGTNAGAKLVSGKTVFLVSEGEWGRLIGETGIFFGLILIFVRIHLIFRMGAMSLKENKNENFLPWLLLSFTFVQILQGQWAQPTILGFSILSGGLVLASIRKTKKNKIRFSS